MKVESVKELRSGDKVTLRDGRSGIFLEYYPLREYNYKAPPVMVNMPNDDGIYSHDEFVWQNQTIRKSPNRRLIAN